MGRKPNVPLKQRRRQSVDCGSGRVGSWHRLLCSGSCCLDHLAKAWLCVPWSQVSVREAIRSVSESAYSADFVIW